MGVHGHWDLNRRSLQVSVNLVGHRVRVVHHTLAGNALKVRPVKRNEQKKIITDLTDATMKQASPRSAHTVPSSQL